MNNPTAYIVAGTRDGIDLQFVWCLTIFSLDTTARQMEHQGYKTKAWQCGTTRERLW